MLQQHQKTSSVKGCSFVSTNPAGDADHAMVATVVNPAAMAKAGVHTHRQLPSTCVNGCCCALFDQLISGTKSRESFDV